jgi:hypothetical protein
LAFLPVFFRHFCAASNGGELGDRPHFTQFSVFQVRTWGSFFSSFSPPLTICRQTLFALLPLHESHDAAMALAGLVRGLAAHNVFDEAEDARGNRGAMLEWLQDLTGKLLVRCVADPNDGNQLPEALAALLALSHRTFDPFLKFELAVCVLLVLIAHVLFAASFGCWRSRGWTQ